MCGRRKGPGGHHRLQPVHETVPGTGRCHRRQPQPRHPGPTLLRLQRCRAKGSTSAARSATTSWEGAWHLPNTRRLEESDVDLEMLRRQGCRHLYRADVWFADRMLPEGNASLMRRAREAGMETSLDVNWDPVWGLVTDSARARERMAWLRSTLPFVSFVHGNERELSVFTGRRAVPRLPATCRERTSSSRPWADLRLRARSTILQKLVKNLQYSRVPVVSHGRHGKDPG